MGFGSYDESEQQQGTTDSDDEAEAVNVHQNDHDGEMSVESTESTDALLGQLQDIKENKDEE